MCFYLFLPAKTHEPYQTVYYYPSAWAFELDDFENNFDLVRFEFDFFIKSGSAVVYPILPGMYGRKAINDQMPYGPARIKSNVIAAMKDIQRQLDYLESRDDFDLGKIGYYGFSFGAFVGPIACAVENRFNAAVLTVGGLSFMTSFSGIGSFNFLPRVKIPVLMLNGHHDHVFPLETSQEPMFEYLGTPQEHKRMILYEVGHTGPPRYELIKQSLNWMDTYLGPVEPTI